MLVDPPRVLPGGLTNLSVSSIALLQKCPEKWRRRYLNREREVASPAAALGSAIGRAEGASYQRQITDGHRLLVADVLDAFSDEWALELDQREVAWEGERPTKVKDSGARVLALHHRTVAPTITPVTVERQFALTIPGVDWGFTGYIDVETADGAIGDFKVRSHTKGPVSADEAAGDLQSTAYLFARRAEAAHPDAPDWLVASPEFRYLNLVRPLPGQQPGPRAVVITPTRRTDEQLDDFLALLYRSAAEIAWRAETGAWTSAPAGAWWCSQRYCGFWDTCAFGGARRPVKLPQPRPAIAPALDQVRDAVKATSRKDGTTTAARVGSHLGVTTASAAGSLAALARRGTVRSERPMKRYRTKPDVPLTGPNVYRLLDDGLVVGQIAASLKRQADTAKEAVPA